MKLAVPFELRIFLVIVLVGMVSLLVILDTGSGAGLVGRVIQGLVQPGEPSNTLLISGIDIGQAIGAKSPSISGNEFACFADKNVYTNRGRSTVRYYLLLRKPGEFDGCRIEFAQTEQHQTGLFMRCPSNEDMFAFLMSFEPGLRSEINEDDELEDLHEKTIPMFGIDYTIIATQVDTANNRVAIRFFGGAGTLDLEDTYSDNDFSDGVRVAGSRVMNGRVRIRAAESGDQLDIADIEYRFEPLPAVGKDVFVADHQGTKQHLRMPGGFLGDFDLLFRGIGAAPARATTPILSQQQGWYGGNIVAFKPVGRNKYRMMFANNRGQVYDFPFISVIGGALKYGDDRRNFFFTGAGAGPAFNIAVSDLFAVTSRADRNGITNIVQYDGVDTMQNVAFFDDLAGGQAAGHYDAATGDGTVILGGTEYNFRVDLAEPHSITIDQDNDGTLGGTADIVVAGGAMIELTMGGAETLHIAPELFAEEAPVGGEDTGFTFSASGSEINVDVVSGISLIFNDASDKYEGLSQFGVFVQKSSRETAPDLTFVLPSRQRGASVIIGNVVAAGGQAQGEVLVTCERSEFVKRAQAAKKAKGLST